MEISKKEFLKLPEVPGVYTFWKKNTPIYIGKSINLKSRLNSYLDLHLSPKTLQMVREAERVTYLEVTSDLESLLLESDQIKKYKPKYNIVLKDDKHALYIVITKEEFPRILAVRKLLTINSSFLIAFGPFPSSGNVKIILKMIRKVFPFSDHKIGKKPCLYSHLGLCNPCPSAITGIKNEELRMKNLKQYRQNIRNIKLVLSRKFNVVRKSLEKEMLACSRDMDFEKATTLRDKIKTLDYITQERIETHEFLKNPNFAEDLRNNELKSLSEIVKVDKLNRIECFDIAHLSGVSATASMVVLTDGEKNNSEYKHFKVKQSNSQSDYDSMREIALRRAKHFEDWGKPDLIIVDGGLGQVKVFNEILEQYDVKVVGIAKHPDRLVFPDGVKIRLVRESLNIVSRIRDEAHRFARRLHHKLLSKLVFA